MDPQTKRLERVRRVVEEVAAELGVQLVDLAVESEGVDPYRLRLEVLGADYRILTIPRNEFADFPRIARDKIADEIRAIAGLP